MTGEARGGKVTQVNTRSATAIPRQLSRSVPAPKHYGRPEKIDPRNPGSSGAGNLVLRPHDTAKGSARVSSARGQALRTLQREKSRHRRGHRSAGLHFRSGTCVSSWRVCRPCAKAEKAALENRVGYLPTRIRQRPTRNSRRRRATGPERASL